MKPRTPRKIRRPDPARKARRRARILIGPVPPSRVIEPARGRKTKHKKKAAEDEAE
ncbi:MAG: hypothetical protein ACUVS7_00760 [Bryobacteraceae bacterium]